MTRKALMISAAFVGLVAAAPAMAKGGGTLYQLPLVSGSTETIAFGVTKDQTVAGFWLNSSGNEIGFVGPADGSNYTTFNDDGAGGTQPRGINKKGYITGIDNVQSGNIAEYVPYVRSPDGTITDVTMDGTPLNYLAQGINKKGVFTGSYLDMSGNIFGYTGKNAQYQNGITLPGITTTAVAGRGINDRGDIVGWYADASGVQHGFLLSGGTATTIDNPGGTTNLEGINNKGEISGLYTDTSANRHGFTYDIQSKTFTELTVPNATFVEAWGLNDKGVVAVDGAGASGVFVGYLYCPRANDCPRAAGARSPQVPVLQHVPRSVPTPP
jgi:probable HAF family extracellular repeat protein